MTEFIPAEKGVPIRQPSTANLMLDSYDRSAGATAWNFTINRNNSILNGFFTRIGTTEVVLEWCEYNISEAFSNYEITLTKGAGTHTLQLTDGYYTVKEALDAIVAAANDAGAFGPNNFQTYSQYGRVGIETVDGNPFYIEGAPNSLVLANQLGFENGVASALPLQECVCPDLRPWRYIDFVSSQLTYNQDLKDASTAQSTRDVLCRWYFDWDVPTELDADSQPILMGYKPFKARRIFNPPKQIKWTPNQPIGQLSFEVWGYNYLNPQGVRLDTIYTGTANTPESEWLMTLQVSEV